MGNGKNGVRIMDELAPIIDLNEYRRKRQEEVARVEEVIKSFAKKHNLYYGKRPTIHSHLGPGFPEHLYKWVENSPNGLELHYRLGVHGPKKLYYVTQVTGTITEVAGSFFMQNGDELEEVTLTPDLEELLRASVTKEIEE